MAMTANKQELEDSIEPDLDEADGPANDSSEPVLSEMYCPNCDEIVWAIELPDFFPAIVECENCGYTELAR
jgi:hypothetical protein